MKNSLEGSWEGRWGQLSFVLTYTSNAPIGLESPSLWWPYSRNVTALVGSQTLKSRTGFERTPPRLKLEGTVQQKQKQSLTFVSYHMPMYFLVDLTLLKTFPSLLALCNIAKSRPVPREALQWWAPGSLEQITKKGVTLYI